MLCVVWLNLELKLIYYDAVFILYAKNTNKQLKYNYLNLFSFCG